MNTRNNPSSVRTESGNRTGKRILLLNQFYPPDTAAVAQLLGDLAIGLQSRGHEIHVVCSQRTYNRGTARHKAEDVLDGVHVHRVACTGFGRNTFLSQILDYCFFYVSAALRSFQLPRMDACVCLTTPPYIGIIGHCLQKRRGTPFALWMMDLFDEALVRFGLIPENGLVHRCLSRISRHLYRNSASIVSLGKNMTERLERTGADPGQIHTVHNWMPNEVVQAIPPDGSKARKQWNLHETTLMYSGNMGLGHELDTLVQAAAMAFQKIPFSLLLVGNGRMRVSLEDRCKTMGLGNVQFHPPQPLEDLSDCLAAGDIHFVGQGPGRLGVSVPSKVYGILSVGRPVLFIGPEDCEAATLIKQCKCGMVVPPGDVNTAADALLQLLQDAPMRATMARNAKSFYQAHLGRDRSVSRIISVIESMMLSSETKTNI